MKNNERLRIYTKGNETFYQVNFSSLSDMHTYFCSKPAINKKVFNQLYSETDDLKFYGVPFEETLKYLVNSCEDGYQEYLELKKQLPDDMLFSEKRTEVIKSVQGSRPNVANFVAGSPKAMYRLQRQNEYKFITVHFNLSYGGKALPSVIINRGLLTLNLIKLLEANGYRVKLNTFELTKEKNEIVYISVPLKKVNEKLDERKTYFPFCRQEFLRRDLFRVLETIPVKEKSWGVSYGSTCDSEQIKKYLNIPDTDIFISSPSEMLLGGDSIINDSKKLLDYIEIEKYIDPKQLKIKR